MNMLKSLYRGSLSLLTDLYQLTMAHAYWRCDIADQEAVFSLFFRNPPFAGGYAIAAGLEYVIDYLHNLTLQPDDIAYLMTLQGNDGKPLFQTPFLDQLAKFRFRCDLDAVPEGTIVFPHQPLIRVRGPLLQCQIIETPLLNLINFQTLIATKAARVCQAARGEAVLEFGLRRAQGIDGSLSASRAAFLGGCAATSNVLAGKMFGIPVRGTHAHSWVMSFDSELEAFLAYAEAMPNNCVFLVDTYDSLEGVRKAVEAGRQLRRKGHQMIGIRLDSGDLARLSIEARAILDEGGFPDAVIVASNGLDEHIISSLKDQNARINVWGVGTRLATAYDQPALGGVYKLSAIKEGGQWSYKIKLSEQAIKVNNPGIQQVRRFYQDGQMLADVIFDEELGLSEPVTMVDILDPTKIRTIADPSSGRDLLEPIFRGGECVYQSPTLEESRLFASSQLSQLQPGVKRFLNPAAYPNGLERRLHDLKTRLVLEARRTHLQ